MKEKDKPAFLAEMNRTAAVLKTQVTGPLLEGYWEAFEAVSIEDFSVVCKKARETLDFMPSIRELRSFLPHRQRRDPAMEKLLAPFLRQEVWPDGASRPANSECVEVCLKNAEEAGQAEKRSRYSYERMQPGTKGLLEVRMDLQRHIAEKSHWLEYAEWYRKQEGAPVVPIRTASSSSPAWQATKVEAETEMEKAIRARVLTMSVFEK